jgi:hypothetical protein
MGGSSCADTFSGLLLVASCESFAVGSTAAVTQAACRATHSFRQQAGLPVACHTRPYLLCVIWKRRSMTLSATSYRHTNLLLPPASRKEPSALYVRDVKHAPESRLPAERRSAASLPPLMSRLPSMVPCGGKTGTQALVALSMQQQSHHHHFNVTMCTTTHVAHM